MALKLTKTEAKVMGLFLTSRNESGRIQLWTLPEYKAAHKLAVKGLVRCESHTEQIASFKKTCWGRFNGTKVRTDVWLDVYMTESGQALIDHVSQRRAK